MRKETLLLEVWGSVEICEGKGGWQLASVEAEWVGACERERLGCVQPREGRENEVGGQKGEGLCGCFGVAAERGMRLLRVAGEGKAAGWPARETLLDGGGGFSSFWVREKKKLSFLGFSLFLVLPPPNCKSTPLFKNSV